MFYFLIALFGGIYIFARYTKEKNTYAALDQEAAERSATYRRLEAKYVASSEEIKRVQDYIDSGEHFEEIYNELEKDFQFVLGLQWNDILKEAPSEAEERMRYLINSDTVHILWVYRLLLATQGKIEDRLISGLCFPGELQTGAIDTRFMQCLEKRLWGAGAEELRIVLKYISASYAAAGMELGHFRLEGTVAPPLSRIW